MEKILEMKDIVKDFGDFRAVDHVDFSMEKGEIVAIIGPSGSGKSTLLRCINGLNKPTSGEVILKGETGMVFQHFNLFPHMTCMENITYAPIKVKKQPKEEALRHGRELLKMVGLESKADVYPAMLSGGQKQRVAIARALAMYPDLMLFDEATSALDPQTTQSILSLIRDIHDKLGITVIVITHQMNVVEQICTKVAILDQGTVVEEGAVSDVFASPTSDAAKRLVYPEGYEQSFAIDPDVKLIRVVFNGANATKTPLIAQMALDEGITASILSASTRSIGDKAYGNMLLGISDTDNSGERAMAYLRRIPDIYVEEVKNNG